MDQVTTFEWDGDKATANWRKHGVTFQQAMLAFRDPFGVKQIDEREDYPEERINLIGLDGDVMLHVTYTERGERVRIISARRAEEFEQEEYYRQNAT